MVMGRVGGVSVLLSPSLDSAAFLGHVSSTHVVLSQGFCLSVSCLLVPALQFVHFLSLQGIWAWYA